MLSKVGKLPCSPKKSFRESPLKTCPPHSCEISREVVYAALVFGECPMGISGGCGTKWWYRHTTVSCCWRKFQRHGRTFFRALLWSTSHWGFMQCSNLWLHGVKGFHQDRCRCWTRSWQLATIAGMACRNGVSCFTMSRGLHISGLSANIHGYPL